MTEKAFQRAVVEAARLLGWRVYHTYDSRRSEPGFPDLVLARGERLIFAELKAEAGRLTAAQKDWLAALKVANRETYVWRPSDWSTIQATLQKGAAAPVTLVDNPDL